MAIIFPEKEYGGYIFDCDGTLANSMKLHHEIWRKALAKFGAKFDFTAEMFKGYAGVGHADTVILLNERFDQQLPPEEVAAYKESMYGDQLYTLEPIHEVCDFAREMQRLGRPVSVASGGRRDQVRRSLEVIGMLDVFDIICTQDDITRSKPDPEIFLLAAKRMGVAPEKCVVFEDSPLGFKGAKDGNMDWVVIPHLF